jgi:hypothetical protein
MWALHPNYMLCIRGNREWGFPREFPTFSLEAKSRGKVIQKLGEAKKKVCFA